MPQVQGGLGASHRPQFFKVLLPSSFLMLRIPPGFANKHLGLEGHRCTATLFSPLGKFWHVALHRDGADVCLSAGWPEFAEAHGLGVGFMVVLRYEGNMVFTVKVFDPSGCQREYVSAFQNQARPGSFRSEGEPENGDIPHDALHSPMGSSSKKPKLSMPKVKNSINQSTIEEKPTPSILLQAENAEKMGSNQTFFPRFVKTVRPYNLTYKYMSVPKTFCTSNGLISKCNMALKDSEGGAWPVSFYFRTDEGRLGNGWAAFSLDKKLRDGDVCYFKLVAQDTLLVRVIKGNKD